MRVKKFCMARTVELTWEENRKEIGLLQNTKLYHFPENDLDSEF